LQIWGWAVGREVQDLHPSTRTRRAATGACHEWSRVVPFDLGAHAPFAQDTIRFGRRHGLP
jgi:hypothetical protein